MHAQIRGICGTHRRCHRCCRDRGADVNIAHRHCTRQIASPALLAHPNPNPNPNPNNIQMCGRADARPNPNPHLYPHPYPHPNPYPRPNPGMSLRASRLRSCSSSPTSLRCTTTASSGGGARALPALLTRAPRKSRRASPSECSVPCTLSLLSVLHRWGIIGGRPWKHEPLNEPSAMRSPRELPRGSRAPTTPTCS